MASIVTMQITHIVISQGGLLGTPWAALGSGYVAKTAPRCKGGPRPPTPDVRVRSTVVRAPAADGQASKGAWRGREVTSRRSCGPRRDRV